MTSNIYTASAVQEREESTITCKRLDGFGGYACVPARPKTRWSLFNRIKLACLVFVGAYDALDWDDSRW